MSADASNAEDSRELEDLFDSIALAQREPAAAPANDATCDGIDDDCDGAADED